VILETHDLSIGYKSPNQLQQVIAEHLNLSIGVGELVCLLGPNGAGKSTLLRTIAGMQPMLGGKVRLADADIAALSPRHLAQKLSVVLTERPNLGLLNGYALVALGRHPYTDWTGRLSRQDEDAIRWAVDAVGASDIAEHPVMEVSDGQRQKLMIARALAQESDLILLDEPTAFLDLPRRAEIMHLLRRLAAETGRAILLSTHDLDLALRSADTLWLMSQGEVQVGTPEDMVLNGAFEAAFRSEGVAFDRATGTFSVNGVQKKAIAVYGDGVAYTWTRRALERAGYALESTVAANLCIEVEGKTQSPVWHLYQGETRATYSTIADLLEALKQAEEAVP
jgi:iron complex transport system ATP-binding protein